jgi:hypothetical protein
MINSNMKLTKVELCELVAKLSKSNEYQAHRINVLASDLATLKLQVEAAAANPMAAQFAATALRAKVSAHIGNTYKCRMSYFKGSLQAYSKVRGWVPVPAAEYKRVEALLSVR